MALTIPNVTTQDAYVNALTLGPIPECVGIKYVVANASVLAQTAPKLKSGTPADWSDEVLITPEANTLQDCDGIRFRSAAVGVPAQVVATLYLPADAKFGAGTPFTSILSSSGAVGSGVQIPEVQLAAWPPASPTEQQVVVLVLPASYDPAGGKPVRWLCQYDATNAIWHVLGGPAIRADVATAESTTSTTYAALTTPLTLALPRPGDYDVLSECLVVSSVSATALEPYQSYDVGATGAIDIDAARGGMVANGPGWNGVVSRLSRKIGLAAVTLTAKYKETHGSGANLSFSNRFLAAMPIRIT